MAAGYSTGTPDSSSKQGAKRRGDGNLERGCSIAISCKLCAGRGSTSRLAFASRGADIYSESKRAAVRIRCTGCLGRRDRIGFFFLKKNRAINPCVEPLFRIQCDYSSLHMMCERMIRWKLRFSSQFSFFSRKNKTQEECFKMYKYLVQIRSLVDAAQLGDCIDTLAIKLSPGQRRKLRK